MQSTGDWEARAACRSLTPLQVDAIFFPGSGGKPTKAKAFCSNVNCPVSAECLKKAIEEDLEGFYAGTTRKERRVMAQQWHIQLRPLINALPDEPDRTPKRPKVKPPKHLRDTVDYLDTLVEPDLLVTVGIAPVVASQPVSDLSNSVATETSKVYHLGKCVRLK